jgi:hypothetical protein
MNIRSISNDFQLFLYKTVRIENTLILQFTIEIIDADTVAR